jgi:putative SOS response-associated peptidase YedK
MPGRFSLTVDTNRLQEAFPWLKYVPDDFRPRYNIAPTSPVAVILNEKNNHLDFVTWGLIPAFSNSVKMTTFLTNARAEGIERKSSFRSPFKRRRCLVLADGYYEWVKIPRKKEKIPYYVHLKSRQPFAFAGLWDSWESIDGSEVKTCCFITCEPNELVAQIHHRMGVILLEKDFETWLQPDEADPKALLPLLKPFPAEEMAYYQVSTLVSNARNDSPKCIVPVEEAK